MRDAAGRLLLLLLLSTLASLGAFAEEDPSPVRHDFAPVLNYTTITSGNRTRYEFLSPGLNYYAFIGRRGGLVTSMTLFMPSGGRQSDYNFATRERDSASWESIWNFYNLPIGYDVHIGVGTSQESRFTVNRSGDRMTINAAIGLHLNGIHLRHTEFSNRYFDSLTFGVGVDIRAAIQLDQVVSIGWMLNTNYDFLDLIHSQNAMVSFFNLNTGFLLGLRFGGGS